jgi:hypothetical protein
MKYLVFIIIFPLRLINFNLSWLIHIFVDLLSQEDKDWLLRKLMSV